MASSRSTRRPPVCLSAVFAVCFVLLVVAAPGSHAARTRKLITAKSAQSFNEITTPQAWMKEIETAVAGVAGIRSWSVMFDTLSGTKPAPKKDGQELQQQLAECWNEENSANAAKRGGGPDLSVLARFSAVPALRLAQPDAAGAQPADAKPVPIPNHVVTLSTTTSLSRLSQLAAQCKSWSGPLSAVVYMPVYVQDVQDKSNPRTLNILGQAVLQVVALLEEVGKEPTACSPDIMLVWELFTGDVPHHILLPVNMLRNMARLQARTPLLMQLDVDLLVRRGLADELSQADRAKQLLHEMQDEQRVYILPALHVSKAVERVAWADALTTINKDVIQHTLGKRLVMQQEEPGWPSQLRVNLTAWMLSVADYPVPTDMELEPWFIGDRVRLPWHDERHRGHAWNKVQHLMDTAALGFQFWVLHDAWVVHRANPELAHGQGAGGLHGHGAGLSHLALKPQADSAPWVHPATANCQAQLPGWKSTPRTIVTTHGKAAPITPRRAAAAAMGESMQDPRSELLLATDPDVKWARKVQTAMSRARGVSWKVSWEDMGVSGLSAGLLQDNPNQDGASPDMMKVVDCINSQFTGKPAQFMSWNTPLAESLDGSSFKIVGTWWTNGVAPSKPMTIVTSGSVNRLQQLYAVCKSWDGPLSAALYIPLVLESGELTANHREELRNAVLKVSKFVADMQQVPNSCQPDIMVFYEPFRDAAASKLLIPLNIPRNLARLQARTPLIAAVDVDLVVSRSLSDRFKDMSAAQSLIEQAENKNVFVIPAFDINDDLQERAAWAEALVSADKDTMVWTFQNGISEQFKVKVFKGGHKPTNYPHWVSATGDYPITHNSMYEPWYIGSRTQMPWHDDRYRGYGKNKVQYVEDTAAKGFTFNVLHDAFTIHREHERTEVAKLYVAQKKQSSGTQESDSLYTQVNRLYDDQHDMHDRKELFLAPMHPAVRSCQQSLPWWQGASSLAHLQAAKGEAKQQAQQPAKPRAV